MDLATLMFVSYRSMDERVQRAMREAGYDVTVAQSRLAQRIADEGSRLTELADRAQVTKQTASLLVAALEREGLVERVPDPSDGRARLIRLSARGREAARTGDAGRDRRRAGVDRAPRSGAGGPAARGAAQAARDHRPLRLKRPGPATLVWAVRR